MVSAIGSCLGSSADGVMADGLVLFCDLDLADDFEVFDDGLALVEDLTPADDCFVLADDSSSPGAAVAAAAAAGGGRGGGDEASARGRLTFSVGRGGASLAVLFSPLPTFNLMVIFFGGGAEDTGSEVSDVVLPLGAVVETDVGRIPAAADGGCFGAEASSTSSVECFSARAAACSSALPMRFHSWRNADSERDAS